jgi:hypothetical protein
MSEHDRDEAMPDHWIRSEQAELGAELQGAAILRPQNSYLPAQLRVCFVEHLAGVRFWPDLDRGDFGLLARAFSHRADLVNEIVERIRAGAENLDILVWAVEARQDSDAVFEILEALDVNCRQLSYREGPEVDQWRQQLAAAPSP